ncbi:MAG: metallophosphoesterase [Myxococcota bacterium]
MSTIKLTNSVANELAALHGSHEKALAYRNRAVLPGKPAAGAPTIQGRVLVINDLHIGAGRDPETLKYVAGDDFTATQGAQLIAYMANEWAASATGNDASLHPVKAKVAKTLAQLKWGDGSTVDLSKIADLMPSPKYPLTLCINGDFVDFLQTTVQRPGMPYPDGFNKEGAPKNTPANSIVALNVIRQGHPEVFRMLAVHLRLGHKIDFIPGNHDRHIWNPYVWSGSIQVEGKKLGGFVEIMKEELRSMGASDAEVKDSLSRLERKMFATYGAQGDIWVDHGDMGDRHNRVNRPYGEFLAPSGLHEEMSMALGDYGVRGGFNQFEPLDPNLDAIDDRHQFFQHVFKHPLKASGLIKAFLKGAEQEGYEKSTEADAAQRLADVRAMVESSPYIMEQLNAGRSGAEKFSKEDVIAGLENVEKASARPFFSNFKRGTLLVTRLASIAKKIITHDADLRPQEAVYVDRLEAAHKSFGTNAVVHGHTHQARDESYLSQDEKHLRYVNTHTWMSKDGDWGRPTVTWGADGRGVGVIEFGVDESGKPWQKLALEKVIDDNGSLVAGDLLEDPETNIKGSKAAARDIYYANHPPVQLDTAKNAAAGKADGKAA